MDVTAGAASGVPFSGMLCNIKFRSEILRVCKQKSPLLYLLCPFMWESHPVRSMNRGQSIQVRHGELQPAFSQVVINIHYPHQGGRATKRISPRLLVGMKKYDENVEEDSIQTKTKIRWRKKSKMSHSV